MPYATRLIAALCILSSLLPAAALAATCTEGAMQMCTPTGCTLASGDMAVQFCAQGDWTECMKVTSSPTPSGSVPLVSLCEGITWGTPLFFCQYPCSWEMVPLTSTSPPFGCSRMPAYFFGQPNPLGSGGSLLADPDNCGACGNVCPADLCCSNGQCIANPSVPGTPRTGVGGGLGAPGTVGCRTPCGLAAFPTQFCQPQTLADAMSGSGVWSEVLNWFLIFDPLNPPMTYSTDFQRCQNVGGAWQWSGCQHLCVDMQDPQAAILGLICPTWVDCGSATVCPAPIDVLSDPQNCGTCGNACQPGWFCALGKCLPEQPGREQDRCTLSIGTADWIRDCATTPCGAPAMGKQICCNGYWTECFDLAATECSGGSGMGLGVLACRESGGTWSWSEPMNFDCLMDLSGFMSGSFSLPDTCCEPSGTCDPVSKTWSECPVYDFSSDRLNCGACGYACGAWQECRDRRCEPMAESNTALVLTSSAPTSVVGQPVTFTARVSTPYPEWGPPSGLVQFRFAGSDLGAPVALAGGVAVSPAVAPAAVGNYPVAAAFAAPSFFLPSTGSLIQAVSRSTVVVTLAHAPNPSAVGQEVPIQVAVTPYPHGVGTPTGTVTVTAGALRCTAPLAGGRGTCPFTFTSLGTVSLQASYPGDADFMPGGATALHTVSKASTTTAVSLSANPGSQGQPLTLTALVSPVPPATVLPTGSVTLHDGAALLGSGTLAGGKASFTTSTLGLGNHTISASYAGDAACLPSASPGVVLTIKAGSLTTLTAAPSPSVTGQSVTLQATVAPALPSALVPGGTVTFLDGAATLGTAALAAGKATLSRSNLAPGSHPLTARYGGDATFGGSTSAALSHTVNRAASRVTVTSSLNPANVTMNLTFTVTVAAVAPGAGTPTGSVVLSDGAVVLGTGTLAAGKAVFSTAALAEGDHALTAAYAGDASFLPGTGTLTQTVWPPPRLLAPNGGEVLHPSDLFGVTWLPHALTTRHQLLYSLNGGTTWASITTSARGTASSWPVPAVRGNYPRSLLKIVGYNAAGTMIWTDVADRQFTIESLKVTSPNGGETVASGGPLTATWQAWGLSGIASTTIEVTTNGGASWRTLGTIVGAGTGTWSGTAPVLTVPSTGCKARVSQKDASGRTVRDESDSWFTIR
jgi:hypothetical protein